jgi:hypothetical protein
MKKMKIQYILVGLLCLLCFCHRSYATVAEWTPEEDEVLWTILASSVKIESWKTTTARYNQLALYKNHSYPFRNIEEIKQRFSDIQKQWTKKEDDDLIEKIKKLDLNFNEYCKYGNCIAIMPRTFHECYDHYNKYLRKKDKWTEKREERFLCKTVKNEHYLRKNKNWVKISSEFVRNFSLRSTIQLKNRYRNLIKKNDQSQAPKVDEFIACRWFKKINIILYPS